LKHVWPNAKLGIYCEFYYKAEGGDVGFDPEFPVDLNAIRNNLLFKNLNNEMHFKFADAGLSPTHWQASTFPELFRSKISVVHDGIDTADLTPDDGVKLSFESGRIFTKNDKIITFVNRHIEPYRGCHTFLRALPEILSAHRDANVFIIGSEGVSYGAKPQGSKSWKQIYWDDEVAPKLDDQARSRVHFMGRVDYSSFKKILALSSAHVYLTYPFVLSWSLLEAMSIGCPIVASDTPPVAEVIQDQENGYLFDFFSPDALAGAVIKLLGDDSLRAQLSNAARQFVCTNYDLQNVCLPRQIEWVESLASNA
jgi:glycosyltransferase involved in cell wall biosynthesis